jgi:hypothetical protein
VYVTLLSCVVVSQIIARIHCSKRHAMYPALRTLTTQLQFSVHTAVYSDHVFRLCD